MAELFRKNCFLKREEKDTKGGDRASKVSLKEGPIYLKIITKKKNQEHKEAKGREGSNKGGKKRIKQKTNGVCNTTGVHVWGNFCSQTVRGKNQWTNKGEKVKEDRPEEAGSKDGPACGPPSVVGLQEVP